MTDKAPHMLDYAPAARRRWPWRRIVIGVLLVAIAGAGKLCWDKFSPVVQDHLAVRRFQAALDALPPVRAIRWNATDRRGGPLRPMDAAIRLPHIQHDDSTENLFNRPSNRWWQHGRFGLFGWNDVLWAGSMRSVGKQDCIVILRGRDHTPDLKRVHGAVIVYVVTKATLLRPSRTLQPPQPLRLDIEFPITFSNVRLEADASRLVFGVVAANGSGTVSFTLEADGTMRGDSRIVPP